MPPALPDLGFAELAVLFSPLGRADDLVGGDFYDIVPLADDTWCVMLGDVSGKGVAAAALASATRWTFRSVITHDSDPARALEDLNGTLVAQDWEGRFVTVVAASLRQGPDDTITVRCAVGGHPPPIVRRRDGQCEAVTTEGTLIGALPSGTWHTTETMLHPGDALVLYSDGLTETAAPDGEFFGEERLVSALDAIEGRDGDTAEGILKRLHFAATTFGQQRDDLAVLVIACRPTPGSP
jgi:sigma-B regulation protein RsbU (phosphoserine phosphatase)